jgi:magnesium transporter
MLMAVCHSTDEGWSQIDDLERVSDLRAERGTLLWAEADVANLTHEDVETIAEEFGLHELAVEDAVHTRQRPKFETYDTHLFLVTHELNEQDGQLEAAQLASFIGDSYVLTIHAGATRTISEAKRRWLEQERTLESPSQLVYTLLDALVDDYQTIADRLENEIEELEELVLETPRAPVQRQLYSLKQQVSRLRRYAIPATRLLDWVTKPDVNQPFAEEYVHLFRDVHDHLIRISEQIRNVDDLAQAVLDLTQSAHAQALNEVSKKLTAWAAIFGVETLIAGVYGMNFELVPYSGQVEGFWFALVLMVVCGVALFGFFRRKDWI